VTLLAELEDFVRGHRPGGMTGDATEPASNGYRLTVACACGVVFDRWTTPGGGPAGPRRHGVAELIEIRELRVD